MRHHIKCHSSTRCYYRLLKKSSKIGIKFLPLSLSLSLVIEMALKAIINCLHKLDEFMINERKVIRMKVVCAHNLIM